MISIINLNKTIISIVITILTTPSAIQVNNDAFDISSLDEFHLKRVLVEMATKCGKIKNTADIAKLKFGEDCSVPADLLFNNVPHAAWVSYVHFISLRIV